MTVSEQYDEWINSPRSFDEIRESIESYQLTLALLEYTQGCIGYVDFDSFPSMGCDASSLGVERGLLLRYEDELYSVDVDVWNQMYDELVIELFSGRNTPGDFSQLKQSL